MADMTHWLTCISRLYYVCFYSVTALLIQHDLAPSKHTGVRAFCNNQFVAKGVIPREQGKFYNLLFKYRQQSDYEDFFSIDGDIVRELKEPMNGGSICSGTVSHLVETGINYVTIPVYCSPATIMVE